MDWSAAIRASLWFWVYDFTKITVMMAVLFYGLMYLKTYLTPATISRALTNYSSVSYPLAAFFGVLSPFCSCSSIPLFLGFLGMGVGLGATLTFLLTSPMVNLAALSILPTMVGIKVTLLYALAGVTVAMVGGAVLQMLGFERYVDRPDMSSPPEDKNQDRWRIAYEKTREQMVELLPYVAGGTAVGAVVHGFIPASWLEQYASGPFAVPMAVVIGIPMYTNVLAALPVIEALIGKGVAVPIAIAFLMSATGLSVPEFIMLKKVLDIRLLAALILVIGVSIIGVGYGLYLV